MTDTKDDEWEYYIVHDSIGISHVMRRKKGEHPAMGCDGRE